MNNVFVMHRNSILIGVYSSHRKAIQDMIMETIPSGYTLGDYRYDFGIEFFSYNNEEGDILSFELQEITPDERV